jgi:hypothetical protein
VSRLFPASCPIQCTHTKRTYKPHISSTHIRHTWRGHRIARRPALECHACSRNHELRVVSGVSYIFFKKMHFFRDSTHMPRHAKARHDLDMTMLFIWYQVCLCRSFCIIIIFTGVFIIVVISIIIIIIIVIFQ